MGIALNQNCMEENTVATTKKTAAKTTAKKTTAKKPAAKKAATTKKAAPAKKATAKKTTAKKTAKSGSGLLGGISSLSDLNAKLNSKDTAQKIKSTMKTIETVKGFAEVAKGGGAGSLVELGKKAVQSKIDSILDEDK